MVKRSNQFEESSKDKSLKDFPLPPLPFAHHIKEEPEKKERNKDSMSLEDALGIIQKMRKTHDDINRQVEEVYQQMGWTPNYIKMFLDNPNNFDSKQLNYITKERESLMRTFKLPNESQEATKGASKKPGKKSSGRTAAARRQWIPMK